MWEGPCIQPSLLLITWCAGSVCCVCMWQNDVCVCFSMSTQFPKCSYTVWYLSVIFSLCVYLHWLHVSHSGSPHNVLHSTSYWVQWAKCMEVSNTVIIFLYVWIQAIYPTYANVWITVTGPAPPRVSGQVAGHSTAKVLCKAQHCPGRVWGVPILEPVRLLLMLHSWKQRTRMRSCVQSCSGNQLSNYTPPPPFPRHTHTKCRSIFVEVACATVISCSGYRGVRPGRCGGRSQWLGGRRPLAVKRKVQEEGRIQWRSEKSLWRKEQGKWRRMSFWGEVSAGECTNFVSNL